MGYEKEEEKRKGTKDAIQNEKGRGRGRGRGT
jgi:hypothetical protein